MTVRGDHTIPGSQNKVRAIRSPAPTPTKHSPVQWARHNLFSTPSDTILTLVIGCLSFLGLMAILNWAVFDATWIGTSREACTTDGACWVFVRVKFMQFLVGFYPEAELWRVGCVALVGLALGLPLILPRVSHKKVFALVLVTVYPLLTWKLLYGGSFGLEIVPTSKWGGLMLTLIIAIVGIAASLPLGIGLALGRRSNLPILRSLSVIFIELWRAVPLITVLFMASVMLPLFLPEGVTFDKLIRALVGVTLFSAAYMAEVVRGGLQAIPSGQFEAASAMGLRYWQSMRLIILPQALKKVIPGIVNTFIGLFKDTTLVLIIGMFDLLGIVQAAATDPDWLGYSVEGYVFAAFVFWIFCFSMSRMSQHLERKLNHDH